MLVVTSESIVTCVIMRVIIVRGDEILASVLRVVLSTITGVKNQCRYNNSNSCSEVIIARSAGPAERSSHGARRVV